ncbi:Carboxypeptidase [Nesidiocoris tenuis]|uniref:Carboxypeptidase n=1 Tax=Nesidiocoris tenuis TaxID=355587 RepID=A0ABN7AF19_9HEMI|nr:Carboxypeptidase [Nesidiocoris tenuis]
MGLSLLLLGIICASVHISTTSPIADSASNTGKPLFLTPYVEEGRFIEARTASRVPSLPGAPTVESYSGYLTVNKEYNSNLFFWFFPAENNRQKAPFALWLQGGPGGSSLYGTFAENGPFSINEDDLTLTQGKHYWSQELNMIYIDSPVGTGFSFTQYEEGFATNETRVGADLYSALVQFFQLFPEYKKNKFFITGESYAGKYIPALAHTIHVNNPSADLKINLVGFAIGDGWIDPRNMMVYSEYLLQHGIVDEKTAAAMKIHEKNATALIDQKKFHEATEEWHKVVGLFEAATGGELSTYDYTLVHNNFDGDEDLISRYLNQPHVRKAIHVGDLVYNDGSKVSQHLFDDMTKSVADWLEELLDHYKVLLYNGQLDIIVAYPLTMSFVKTLKWSGAAAYAKASRELWYVENELAGFHKTVGNFTEILVRNAGHMVPGDQPLWALDMITRFTQGIPF